MLTKNILFKNFTKKKTNKKIKKSFISILKEKNEIIKSLGTAYKSSYKIKSFKNLKKNSNFRIIGMGGSILGTESIYNFLQHKIKKNFQFINNLNPNFSSSHDIKSIPNVQGQGLRSSKTSISKTDLPHLK